MGGEAPAICAACGTPLGPVEEELDHPEDDNPPDDPHFTVQVRESDGAERYQCNKTGQIAAVAAPGMDDIGNSGKSYAELFQEHHGEMPPGMGEPSGPTESESNEPSREETEPGGIYDVQKEKNQVDLLEEVVTNPRYGLNDDHIQEVKGWAMDMNGRLPPATLEDILKNLKGVQKQTASLIRQRYELKLNKWMREQSRDDRGPQIGVTAPAGPGQSGSSLSGGGPTPTPSTPQNQDNQSQPERELDRRAIQDRGRPEPNPDNLREYRRISRTRRRQKFADTATQKIAEEAADEVARQIIPEMGRYLGLPAKAIEAKIEKDPDWVFEVAERFDIDLLEIMEPSEQRKKEMREEGGRSSTEVDSEIDKAMNQVSGRGDESERDIDETTKGPPPQEEDEPIMREPEEDEIFPDPEADMEEPEQERAGEELFE